MKTFIDFIYTLLIGAAVILFVSLGIWSFYQSPKYPMDSTVYPTYPGYPNNTDPVVIEEYDKKYQAAQAESDKNWKEYEKSRNNYEKKVGSIALGAGVVFYVAGWLFMKRHNLIAEGLALGGIFTTIYAIVQSAAGEFRQIVFASGSALLAMTILLVLRRTQPNKK
jgi:hypothetical protein